MDGEEDRLTREQVNRMWPDSQRDGRKEETMLLVAMEGFLKVCRLERERERKSDG